MGYRWDGDGSAGPGLGASWPVLECRFDPLVGDSYAATSA
jgi:hypothetical protein